MGGLGAALLWYQKKIGAYDKQLWEKTVEQHILRNVDSLPKKNAKLKPELIDVDLVRGSAFPKAKPQHGWISTTSFGILRVLFLPLYCSWWKQQTSKPVCGGILILYVLQLSLILLYFTSDESVFQNVSTSEIMTPVAMMIVIGVVHSQIVSTVSNKKIHKNLRRTKRKRIKRSPALALSRQYVSKSSPETVSEELNCLDVLGKSSLQVQRQHIAVSPSDLNITTPAPPVLSPFPNEFKNSDEESGLDSLDIAQSQDPDADLLTLTFSPKAEDDKHSLKTSHENSAAHIKTDKGSLTGSEDSNKLSLNTPKEDSATKYVYEEDFGENSSGEELFVARPATKPAGYSIDFNDQQNRDLKDCSGMPRRYSMYSTKVRTSAERQMYPLHWRRFSDFESKTPSLKLCCPDGEKLFGPRVRSFSDGNSLQGEVIEPENGHEYAEKRLNNGVPMMAPTDPPYSSCESEGNTTPATPNKPHSSDVEWPILTNTDCNSDSTDSAESDQDDVNVPSAYEDPLMVEQLQEASGQFFSPYSGSDKGRGPSKVSCAIWERNECKKVDLTVFDVSSAIVLKVDSLAQNYEYLIVGLCSALIIAILPLLFRLQYSELGVQEMASEVLLLTVPTSDGLAKFLVKLENTLLGNTLRTKFVILGALLERFTLSAMYFFLLAVAERTFKQRFLYAKVFCHLTSARRARRSDLPHFRLNKVRNIKTWLSVRSFLKKHGPQRSVDVVVSTAFILIVCLLSFLCLQLLQENEQFVDRLYFWEILFWCLALGLFLMRFMILGSKINKKYRNLSALTTEQINLYLHMEQKPHKKEELMLANNVLKLAIDLLKELESPYKISGLRANPYLYNITKVVVLSAFSAVLTELLGFKLKLNKIKIK